jgi:putative toxin-antitoxin system antitoxin component (TIGR02293 family)
MLKGKPTPIKKKGPPTPARVRKMHPPTTATKTKAEEPRHMGINAWLGLKSSKPLSEFDIIELGNTGITKSSLDHLTAAIGMSRKYMAEKVLDISIKTLERKTPTTRLDKKISSHALEIARTCEHAFEVFQDQEIVNIWFHRENQALNNQKPVELFSTLTGINLVNDILTRIEEGVYS